MSFRGRTNVPDCTLSHVGLALQRYALQIHYYALSYKMNLE